MTTNKVGAIGKIIDILGPFTNQERHDILLGLLQMIEPPELKIVATETKLDVRKDEIRFIVTKLSRKNKQRFIQELERLQNT